MSSTLVRGCLGVILAFVTACHEVPQAPSIVPPILQAQTLNLDSVRCKCGDISGYWQGAELLVAPDGTMHILSEDGWDGEIRYAGCSGSCDRPQFWWTGSVDTSDNIAGGSLGAVITNAGITVVSSGAAGVNLWQCAGGCGASNHWQSAFILFLGRISGYGAHVHPLAADSTGGLHLAFFSIALFPQFPKQFPLEYGYCPAACLNSASWQAVVLDSAINSAGPYQIRTDAGGHVHLAYTAFDGHIVYAVCPGTCLDPTNWRSTNVAAPSLSGPEAMSFVVTPSGGVRMVYLAADSLRYGACDSDCWTPTRWSWSSLRNVSHGYDVSLALGLDGALHLATTEAGVLNIASCEAACDSGSSWTVLRADSAVASFVSLAVDRTGTPQVASSANNLQYTSIR